MVIFRKALTLILLSTIVLGMISFFIGFSMQCGAAAGGGISNIEMPFGEVQGLIVKDNRIYVGCKDYKIVQVFSKDGVFEKSWNLDNTYGNDFFFTVNENQVPIATRTWLRDNSLEELKKLSKNDLSNIMKQIMYPNVYTTSTGVVYTMEGETIKELTENRSGKKRVVIEQGLIMGLLANPKKPAGIAITSLLLLVLVNFRTFKMYFRWSDSSSFWETIGHILKANSRSSETQ